jgi:hypothetical protein
VSLLPSRRKYTDNCTRIPIDAMTDPHGEDLPDSPCIFTGCCSTWPAFVRPGESWSVPDLAERVDPEFAWSVDGGPSVARFSFNEGRVSMREYMRYCDADADGDAAPLYIFEPQIPLRDEFSVPPSFARDMMGSITGSQFRPLPPGWLLVGARRSGTPIHDHPMTVGWNALLSGAKLWVVLPPDVDRKLLLLNLGDDEDDEDEEHEGEDEDEGANADGKGERGGQAARGGARESEGEGPKTGDCDRERQLPGARVLEATSTAGGGGEGEDRGEGEGEGAAYEEEEDYFDLSALDWFSQTDPSTLPEGAVVAVQMPGEVVFLPAGWWHVVLNVRSSVAMSHSLALRKDVPRVLPGLRKADPAFAAFWEERMQGNGAEGAELAG